MTRKIVMGLLLCSLFLSGCAKNRLSVSKEAIAFRVDDKCKADYSMKAYLTTDPSKHIIVSMGEEKTIGSIVYTSIDKPVYAFFEDKGEVYATTFPNKWYCPKRLYKRGE